MGLYAKVILPKLCHFGVGDKRLLPYRERVTGAAEGRVLEVGVGSGLNLPFYRESVREIFGLEPSPQLISMARRAAKSSVALATFIERSAESIPLDDKSIDTVVTTWTLCTIPRGEIALKEAPRPQARGSPALRRARIGSGCERAKRAKFSHPGMEARERRLPFEPADRKDDRKHWLPP
jgi:SAM-dependent methyltransferase